MKTWIILAAMIAIAGCMTARPPPIPAKPRDNVALLNSVLNAFPGTDATYLVRMFGYPDTQDLIMGDTVYRWHNTISIPFPTEAGGTDWVSAHCTIEVAVSSDNRVKTGKAEGQSPACWRYTSDWHPNR